VGYTTKPDMRFQRSVRTCTRSLPSDDRLFVFSIYFPRLYAVRLLSMTASRFSQELSFTSYLHILLTDEDDDDCSSP
jgi:hypothetical protein